MPPAEADLRRWNRLNDAKGNKATPYSATPTTTATGHGQVSTTAKVACLACRKIKIRCLMPSSTEVDLAAAGPSDYLARSEACIRCTRLGLECRRKPHRKGPRSSKQAADGNATSSSMGNDASQETGSESRPTAKRMASNESVGITQHSHEQHMIIPPPGSLGGPASHSDPRYSPMEGGDKSEWSHNSFSIQSLLGDEHGSGSGIQKTPYQAGGAALRKEAISPASTGLTPGATSSIGTAETPRIVTAGVPTVVKEGFFSPEQARYLHAFFFKRMDGIIALLTPSLNSFERLSRQPHPQLLLTAICTVAAKFEFPDKYERALQYVQGLTSRFMEGEVKPTLSNCQALCILAMWRPPNDPSGWRKVHAACTLAFELALQNTAQQLISPEEPQREELIQRQRTYFHLACFEEFFVNQRKLEPLISWDTFPEPRAWVDSLGNDCLEVDVRIASAMDSIAICRRLSEALQVERKRMPKSRSTSLALREVRLIRLAIHEQEIAAETWLHSQEKGIVADFAMRSCGIFDNLNYQFCYWSSIWVIFSQAEMRSPYFDQDRRSAFAQASAFAIQLIEMFSGPYGKDEYYRYVHDHVICSTAVSAIWIIDNWSAMPREDALRAHQAIRSAKDATSSSRHRRNEQSSYLYTFLNFCCNKLPSPHLLDSSSPVDVGALEVSQNLEWLLGSEGRQRDFSMPYDWTFRSRHNSPPHFAMQPSGPLESMGANDTMQLLGPAQNGNHHNGQGNASVGHHGQQQQQQGGYSNDAQGHLMLPPGQNNGHHSVNGQIQSDQGIDESLASFLSRLLPDSHATLMDDIYLDLQPPS